MADTTKRDILKIGRGTGLNAAICKISNVNNGGTIAISGDWTAFADQMSVKWKRILDKMEVPNRTLALSVDIPLLKGFEVTFEINQRDADTHEFDVTYAGYECLMLVELHYFARLASPRRQWLAVFGTMSAHDSDVNGEDGKIIYTFKGLANAQAVVLTATPASGKITYPSIAGWTVPSADMTIAAFNAPAMTGIYKLEDK